MDVMIKVPRAGLDYGSGHAARVGKHSVIQQRRGIRWTKRASPPLSPVAMADNPFYVKWWRGMPRTRLARLARVATPCRKAEDVESRTTTRSCQSRLVSGWRLSEVEPPSVPTSRWASYQQIHDSPRKSLLIWSCPPPGLRPCSHHSPKRRAAFRIADAQRGWWLCAGAEVLGQAVQLQAAQRHGQGRFPAARRRRSQGEMTVKGGVEDYNAMWRPL
jgi:hypothetical protein